MQHTQILNYLINKYKYEKYLEIGTEMANNFVDICLPPENKECNDIVVPEGAKIKEFTYLMPSDEMFAKMPVDKMYDIIFIDGMHDEEYVDRDIINSLKHLNPGGVICVHDVVPINNVMACPYENKHDILFWTGDVWKSITKLQDNNLEFYTIQNDEWGLTIIKYKDNPHSLTVPQYKSKINYNYIFNSTDNYETCITEQGKYVLHVISEAEFLEKF